MYIHTYVYVHVLAVMAARCFSWVLSTRSSPADRYLHERVGVGGYGEAAGVLFPGLDLSTGETGTVVGAEGRCPRGNARTRPRE